MTVIDAILRSGLSGKVRLTQAGQEGFAPLGFSNLKQFPDANVLYVTKATGTTVNDTLSLALATGVMTAPAGAPTLVDSDGKDVNGANIAMATVYCWVVRKFRAGVLIDEQQFYKGELGVTTVGLTQAAALTQIGDIVEMHVIGKTA